MRAGKTHYQFGGCGFWRHLGTFRLRATPDPGEVTCTFCRSLIRRFDLRSRDGFPKIPTFDVRAEGRFRSAGPDLGCHLTFRCPVCGQENVHGGYYGRPGEADGHRVSHCRCWERGYHIREATS